MQKKIFKHNARGLKRVISQKLVQIYEAVNSVNLSKLSAILIMNIVLKG